tara:strand:+ start:391 stop:1227 length:837 start_codon:yes stop_codon:yes gene_type:complete
MSSIKLLGETSGEVILKAPATAGSSEATLPTGNHTLVGSGQIVGMATADSTTTFTNKSGNISQWTNDSNYITNTVTGDLTVDTSTLKVDSSNNRVGIGTTSPNNLLDVSNTSGNGGMNLSSANSGTSFINFADTDDPDVGQISYVHSDNSMRFKANDNEEMRLESDGDLHVDGDVIAFSTTISDVALKTDIEMIPNALDKIDEVRGVTFTRHNGQKSAGIIAQELEKVLPEAVREKKLALHDGKEYKTVEYDAIHGLLINCIKELKEKIRKLENGSTK